MTDLADAADHLFPDELIRRLLTLEPGRQALTDLLWAEIPSIIVENGYNAAAALSGSTALLTVPPQTSVLVRISNVLAAIPSGATGVIQLGDVTIPIGQGLTSFSCSLLLTQSATRSLQSDTAGPMALVLMGQMLPTYGKMT